MSEKMMPRVHSTVRYQPVNQDIEEYSIALQDADIEGNIDEQINDAQDSDFTNLDEPISETILRDLKAVFLKFRYVLQPSRPESKKLLKEWDLWGPLLLCTFMAILLQEPSSSSQMKDGGPEFAEVFVIVWVGALVVTINCKLLGGQMSIFQSVCVLGYCLLAPAVALVLCRAILLFGRTTPLFIIRLVTSMSAFVWATYACMIFLGESQAEERKVLAGYPVSLFYALICWLVISNTA